MNQNFLNNIELIKGYLLNLFVTVSKQDTKALITTIIIISVILFIFKIMKRRFFLFSLITLPSTIMHESMHYISSLLLLGKPSKFSIFPKKTDTGYTMGYVISNNMNWMNGFIISMAPLFLLPIGFVFYTHYIIGETNMVTLVLKIYLLASMLDGCIPSRQDLKLAVLHPIGLVLIIGLLHLNYR